MLMDPRHLQILWAIVDTGSLSGAARRLGKSQPSLSRTLSELEARLGAPLFEKARRPLRPTELGASLAEEGRVIARAAEAASNTVRNHKRGQSGTLRVGGAPIFMDGVISQMIASFQSAFPDIRIDQSYGYFNDLVRSLNRHEIDLAICPITQSVVPVGFKFQMLLPGRNVIAARAGHPLVRKSALKLDDIAPYPWIAPPIESPLYRDLRQVLSEIGISDTRVSFSGGSLTSMMNVLFGSDALTMLPHSVLFMQRQGRLLSALPIRISHPERQLGLLRLDSNETIPALLRLESYLANQFQALQHSVGEFERRLVWKA